jgi:hypothetical protein
VLQTRNCGADLRQAVLRPAFSPIYPYPKTPIRFSSNPAASKSHASTMVFNRRHAWLRNRCFPPCPLANKRRICYPARCMARRPSPEEFDRPLTPQELNERRRKLATLSPHHVAEAYRLAHEACRMEGDRLPRASAVQELVATWKLLWGWKRQGPLNRG